MAELYGNYRNILIVNICGNTLHVHFSKNRPNSEYDKIKKCNITLNRRKYTLRYKGTFEDFFFFLNASHPLKAKDKVNTLPFYQVFILKSKKLLSISNISITEKQN